MEKKRTDSKRIAEVWDRKTGADTGFRVGWGAKDS